MRYRILILIALVVQGLCRPFFEPVNPDVEVDARRYVQEAHTSRDPESGEKKLQYDVTLKKNVILIDENHDIEEVICNGLETTLVFVKGKSVAPKEGDIIVGGIEWGCVHPLHDRVLPFNRKVVSVKNEVMDSVVIETEIVELTELFSTANISFQSTTPEEQPTYFIPPGTIIGQGVPDTDVDAEEEEEEEIIEGNDEIVRRGDDDLAIGELEDVFFTGDQIVVPYTFSSKYSGKKMEACLRRKRLILDKDVSCQTFTLSSLGKGEVVFTVQSYYESSSSYYVKMNAKWLFGPSRESADIGVNPATMLLSPSHSDEYYQNTFMNVTWYANSSHKNKVVDLGLYKSGIFNKRVQTWQVSLSSQYKLINVNDLSKGAESGKYFFKMTYDCFVGDLFCDLKDTSDEFSLSRNLPGEKSVEFIEPIEGSIYKDEKPMTIQWNSNALSSSETIKVSVCRDTYGIDPCPFSGYKTTNNGKLTIKVPKSWKGSSNYYVVLQHSCKLLWCSSRESRRFSINYSPQFKFLSPTPTLGQIIDYPQTVTVKYELTSGATVTKNTQVSVRLMRQIPFLDLVHNSASVSTMVSTGQHSFSITEGTVFPVRFMIAYNCKLFGYFCQREYSPLFNIPTKYSKNWNYDSSNDRAAERKTIFQIDCDQCKNGNTSVFCKACNKVEGLKSSIDIACTNCYVKSEIKMYDFMLNVNMLGVTGSSLNVQGSATAWVDFLVKFDASYSIKTDFELAHYDLIGTSFKVGPIQVNLYARFALNATLAFTVDGVISATAGFDATVGFKAIASTGGIYGTQRDVKFGLTEFNKHTPVIDMKVNVFGSVGLKPAFDINAVDLLRLWIYVHPHLDLYGKFQIPAMRPGPYPDSNSLAHLGTDCLTTDHYCEFDLRVLIDVKMHASALKKWEWTSNDLTLLNKSLLSGCLFPSKGPLSEITFTVTKTLSELNYDENSFTAGLMNQMLYLVYPSFTASRFVISYPPVDATNKFTKGTFNVRVSALQTDNPYENIELNILADVVKNTYSKFYQNAFGKMLKDIIGVYHD